jgi:GTP:adenosylcobinamide-phosphate guanylyltransferase
MPNPATKKKKQKIRTTEIKNRRKAINEEFTTFIIIADSPIYRMKSYGPVPLIEIKNKKLIDYQIEAITKTYKNYEIILCVGFESNKVTKYIKSKYSKHNIRIIENTNYQDTSSCESLRLSLNNTTNGKVFIIDGNLFFNYKILKLKNKEDNIAYVTEGQSKDFDIGININEHKCAEFFCFGAKHSWSEISYLGDMQAVSSLNKILYNDTFKRKFIFEALNAIIGMNKIKFTVVNHSNEIWKINKPRGT